MSMEPTVPATGPAALDIDENGNPVEGETTAAVDAAIENSTTTAEGIVLDGDQEILLAGLLKNTDELEGLLGNILDELWAIKEAKENGEDPMDPEPMDKDLPKVSDPFGVEGDDPEGGTDTQLWINQENNSGDNDTVNNPLVQNDGSLNQDVDAIGGDNRSEEEADSEFGIQDVLGDATVGDDYSATGTSEATTDAQAFGDLMDQNIDMGANAQLNQVDSSIVGGDRNEGSVGGDDELVGPNPDSRDSNTDTHAHITQTNTLNDLDLVQNPDVINNASAIQNVNAVGGHSESNDGINDFGGATIVAGDDASVDGSTSSSSDGTAVGELLTQDIDVGANRQTNDIEFAVVGTDQNSTSVGDDDLEESGLFSAPGNSDTDTDFAAEQTNYLKGESGNDADVVNSPNVTNNDFLDQDITAAGGSIEDAANADDGVELAGGDVSITATNDSVSISGSASASADAGAQGDLLTQDIDTGANVQRNEIEASIVGDSQNLVSVGDDESVIGEPGIATSTSDTDSVFDIQQSNYLDDQDTIEQPDVVNNDMADQDVTANGGDADSEDGIDLDDGNLIIAAGDDAAVSGSTSATADASAFGELATQELTTGGNVQTNVFDAMVVGINDNLTTIGQDGQFDGPVADAGGGDGVVGGQLGIGTDSIFEITQSNDLWDADQINGPDVLNTEVGGEGGSTLTQTVTANGGDADADAGIEGQGGNNIIATDVGDDLSIMGSSFASAEALAVADMLTQDISMGANFQGNGVAIDIVGGSSTIEDIGEDSLAGV